MTKEQADALRKAGAALWKNAEPGFRERATHDYLAGLFEGLGFAVRPFEGIPGFAASPPDAAAGNGESATAAESVSSRIAVVADMDALPNPEDDSGSYIHSCGHHMQMVALYGAAMILRAAGSPALSRIDFLAIPAEEYIDFGQREELREAGAISRLSGKQELLERGLFGAYGKVVSTHAAGFDAPVFIGSVRAMGGFRVMRFVFHGKAAHAGAAPHKGVNAQNAASLFLQACAYLREGFRDEDRVRIHPVLSYPPDQSVNIIPALVKAETYVRAANPEAIAGTAEKLRAAAEGAAAALGAAVDIEEEPGYAPFAADEAMHETLRSVVEKMGIPFIDEEYSAASSDMGDVSQVLPSVMLGLPGVNGLFHNPRFRVTDEEAAYLLPSVVLARYLEALAAPAG